MRPLAVIVAEVALQATAQVPLVQDDDVVEEFAADRADHAFDEGTLPRRARRREDFGNEHALRASPKLAAINGVAIAQEIARRRVIGESFHNLLRGPSGGRGNP